jgi:hypothetical protein
VELAGTGSGQVQGVGQDRCRRPGRPAARVAPQEPALARLGQQLAQDRDIPTLGGTPSHLLDEDVSLIIAAVDAVIRPVAGRLTHCDPSVTSPALYLFLLSANATAPSSPDRGTGHANKAKRVAISGFTSRDTA